MLIATVVAALVTVARVETPAEPSVVKVGQGVIEVSIGPEEPPVPRDAILAWVGERAEAVARYFGRFPVERVRLRLITGGDRGVGGGMTWGFGVPRIRVHVGRRATTASLADDWVLVHELIHLAMPDQDPSHAWAEEGLSVYLEGVIRAREGLATVEDVWKGYLEGMPNGASREGEARLDGTRSWGRKYWGGALFWLMADVGLRDATQGRASLDDALRAAVAGGASITQDWPLPDLLRRGDSATGKTVLMDLYERCGAGAGAMEPEGFLQRLGVTRGPSGVVLSDTAPLAAIRKAITAPRNEARTGGATPRP